MHTSLALKTQFLEHYLQAPLTQVLQPGSVGLELLGGERVHDPLTRSYPLKHVKQSPVSLSHVLQLSLT